jgi:two-component system sensor histidine kinase MtrB
MAVATDFVTRQALMHDEQAAAVRTAVANASIVRQALAIPGVGAEGALQSVALPPGSQSLVETGGAWFASSISFGRDDVPAALRRLVLAGQPAEQRLVVHGAHTLVVGVPMAAPRAAYFESFPLGELDRTLRVLGLALGATALATTVLGLLLGRYAAARALRPLGAVSRAAASIAGGRLATRLAAPSDPDLEGLVRSFNRMADALEARIQRDARFASDVSHELRSPLTTLNTAYSVLASEAAGLGARGTQALELLGAELRRFERAVEELIELGRADSGSVELALEDLPARDLLAHAARSLGVPAKLVVIQPEAEHAHVRADRRRLAHALRNLVENAEQYAGGVTRLGLEAGDEAVRFVVADRGPGVAPEERERIFERFARGSAARRRGAGQGTGLGLALVAEHVRLHGGRVWVESRAVDEGVPETCFVIELPRADGSSEHRAGDGAAPSASMGSPRRRWGRGRRTGGLLALLLVATATTTAGCGVPTDRAPVALPRRDALGPAVTTSTTPPSTTPPPVEVPITIYLIGTDGRLVPVPREVPFPAPLTAVLAALVEGPTDPEAAMGLGSAIPPGTKILGASVAAGVATVDLGGSFAALSGPSQVEAIAQIVFTATALSAVHAVLFELDGQQIAVPVQTGAEASGPVDRTAYAALAPPGTPLG